MQIEDCFQLGFLLRAHGVKGDIKAIFDVDFVSDYLKKESVYVLQGNKLVPFFIDSIRHVSKKEVIINFRDVHDRNQAEELSKSELYLPLAELPELDSFQFYFHEIKGFTVEDSEKGTLGTVLRVMEMPAQDLLVMDYDGREVLIPITDDIVHEVDREKQIVHTAIPDGLIELF